MQSRCARSGIPDVYVFCIDVIYFIMIVGCNNVIVMLLMLIIVDYSRWISSQDVIVVLVGPFHLKTKGKEFPNV